MIGPEQFVERLTITVRDAVQELALPPVIARSFVVRCHVHIPMWRKLSQKVQFTLNLIAASPPLTVRDDNNTVAQL